MGAVVNRVLPAKAEVVSKDLDRVRRAAADGDPLVLGDRGPAVEALQRSLRRAGVYSGPISGSFDRDTRQAVQQFQAARQLHVTGRVNEGTAHALRDNTLFLADAFEQPARRGQAGADVLHAEQRLAALGYRTGKVDGVFSEKTAQAVKALRADDPELADGRGALDRTVWQNLQQAYQSQVVNGGRRREQSPGDQGKAVRQAERQLDRLGYDVGKVDGQYDAATAAAVAQFQRRNELDVTGRIDDRTAKTIDKAGPSPHASRKEWFISQYRGTYNRNEDVGDKNGNCGPTSVAMIACAFGKRDIRKHKADGLIEEARRRIGQSQNERSGTTISGLRQALKSYGLHATLDQGKPTADTLKRMKADLAEGKLVLANVVPKYFSEKLKYGHFTVVTAIKDGKVYLNDPGTNQGPKVVDADEFLRCLRLRHHQDPDTFGQLTSWR